MTIGDAVYTTTNKYTNTTGWYVGFWAYAGAGRYWSNVKVEPINEIVTTAAPSTTEEPKDENGVPMWAVNAGWPGDEKYLCRVPESCITFSRGSAATRARVTLAGEPRALSKSVCESPDVNIQMVTKWCGPIPKISTLIKEMEGKAFMGFSNKTYREMGGRSVQGRDHKKEYLRETSNGYDTAYPFKVVLKGWTHELSLIHI